MASRIEVRPIPLSALASSGESANLSTKDTDTIPSFLPNLCISSPNHSLQLHRHSQLYSGPFRPGLRVLTSSPAAGNQHKALTRIDAYCSRPRQPPGLCELSVQRWQKFAQRLILRAA